MVQLDEIDEYLRNFYAFEKVIQRIYNKSDNKIFCLNSN